MEVSVGGDAAAPIQDLQPEDVAGRGVAEASRLASSIRYGLLSRIAASAWNTSSTLIRRTLCFAPTPARTPASADDGSRGPALSTVHYGLGRCPSVDPAAPRDSSGGRARS